jgi:glucokinase
VGFEFALQHRSIEEMGDKVLLAGDIGATNTKLAFYSLKGGVFNPENETNLQNKDFKDFLDLLDSYLGPIPRDINGMCLGVAGVVISDQVQVTNLGWDIDGAELKKKYNLEGSWLLNDLKALSYAVPNLRDEDLEVIRTGIQVEGSSIAVIAPGTGLGEGFLIRDGEEYQAQSTEGGHTDFGPINERQIHLLKYLHDKLPRVSYENVCSGIGVPNLYEFLRDEGYANEPDWLREKLEKGDDPTPIIFNTALDPDIDCDICIQTVALFAEILGAEAGNLVLKTLAQGGIYIGGGIPPRILSWIRGKEFINAFNQKDPHTDWLMQIPVMVITNPIANLIGAASFGLRRLQT